MDVRNIYHRRFTPDLAFRKKMWEVLCRDFFQRFVKPDSTVLEIGAGYCEFINNIHAAHKIAVDINSDLPHHASSEVKAIVCSADKMVSVPDGSVDLVFASNFLEHLTRDEIVSTIREVQRVLLPGGKFMLLQPNIRFCAKDYWMFFDHVTPIDDRALTEVLEINGFETLKVIPRFLPYTTQSRIPKTIFFVRLYVRLSILWRIFGKQSFVLTSRL